MKSHPSSSAFTLVELLVSVAIIAILASLLTPAARGAIERARSSKCVGNLRQIGIAMQQYSADHDYRYPAIETVPPSLPPEVENAGTALEILSPYGITQKELICPSDAATSRNYQEHKSSYHFSPVLQDESPASVKIYTPRGIFQIENIGRLTMATDFEAVHSSAGGKIGINVLKADGRVLQR